MREDYFFYRATSLTGRNFFHSPIFAGLHDELNSDNTIEQDLIKNKLIQLLQMPVQGAELSDNLQKGLHTLPSWMQLWVRELLVQAGYKTTGNQE